MIIINSTEGGVDQINYLWLNPVIERMLGCDYVTLLQLLTNKGYTPVNCPKAALLVKKKYLDYFRGKGSELIIDSRCPKVVQLIKENYQELQEHLAPIDSILITCAQELYLEYIMPSPSRNSLTMVTPCTDFLPCGQMIFEDKVRFVTWKDFSQEIGPLKHYHKAKTTPIPLGFFDDLGLPIVKTSGEEHVLSTIQDIINKKSTGYLFEVLYCQDGCHNGDGFENC